MISFRPLGFTTICGLIAIMLTACGGSVTTTPPGANDQNQLRRPRRNPCPCLYVSNFASGRGGASGITVYPIGTTGNVKPYRRLHGDNSGLYHPFDVAVDASGNIYVANWGANSINIFAPNAKGNVAPTAVISGSYTGLNSPAGVAVDPINGNLYVANRTNGTRTNSSITIYAPGSTGNVAPIGTISGPSTGLGVPEELVTDASGNIYVPNPYPPSIYVFAAGSVGDVAPTQTVSGYDAELDYPTQVALDSSLNMYAANLGSNSVTVYAAGANGNVAPIRTVEGSNTQLGRPSGIVLDASGNIYVSNGNSINIYAAGSNGNVAPIGTISGSETKLSSPYGLAIR
jgi:hypothetical protein